MNNILFIMNLTAPLIVVLCMTFIQVHACIIAPRSSATHHAELINRTKTIVLAEAIGFEPLSHDSYRYQFKTIEILKGTAEKRFMLETHSYYKFDKKIIKELLTAKPDPAVSYDFDGHRALMFWDRAMGTGGRVGILPNCRISPFFFLGRQYLIFLEKPFHNKSFEQIEKKDDLWLSAVRKVINKPLIKSGYSQTLFEYLKSKKNIYLMKCPDRNNSKFKMLKRLYGDESRIDSYISPSSSYYFGSSPEAKQCFEGSGLEFLALFGEDDEILWPIGVPIINGNVDFTHIPTEIELKGSKIISLNEVISELKTINFFDWLW